jgi:hypothetical protein
MLNLLIYSIIPPEKIFYDENNDKGKVIEAYYKGITMEVLKRENSSTIARIISTNPKDYLNNNIQPGIEIKNNELSFKQ